MAKKPKVIGRKKLTKKLNNIVSGLDGAAVGVAIQDAADAIMIPDAQRRAQRGRTNDLANSIFSEIRVETATDAQVGVGTNSFYGSYVEFGVGPRRVEPDEADALLIEGNIRDAADVPAVAESPFLRPAYDENEQALLNAIRRNLKIKLAKLVKR